jgi:glycosyltransferase involved in cell wall biosynthesis
MSAGPIPPSVGDLTVVVTNFNHQAYIEQCLDSIAAQTMPPKQVIVIDNCSRDDSVNVIENWLAQTGKQYTFIQHERDLGVCASMNEGLALATGRYFCNVSADDWIENDRFARQVTAFEQTDANTALLVSDIREVDAGGAKIVDHDFGARLGHMTGPEMQSELLSRLLAENVIPAPGTLMRTDLVREIGGYDEDLAFEDYDMWLRLSTRYAIAYQSGIVANYRILDSSLLRSTDRRVAVLRSEAAMLAKHAGSSEERDNVIAQRLVRIAGELLRLGSATALQRVLGYAMTVSAAPWLRRATRTSHMPGGLDRLKKKYATEFDLPRRPASTAS